MRATRRAGEPGIDPIEEAMFADVPPDPPAMAAEAALEVLANPLAYVSGVPSGFRVWLLKQPDGERLWRGWLEETRLSQVERSKQNA